jgi:hypothetical protein
MLIGRKYRGPEKKPKVTTLSPLQIPHDPTWDRTWASEVGSRYLTPWVRARPAEMFLWIATTPSVTRIVFRRTTNCCTGYRGSGWGLFEYNVWQGNLMSAISTNVPSIATEMFFIYYNLIHNMFRPLQVEHTSVTFSTVLSLEDGP